MHNSSTRHRDAGRWLPRVLKRVRKLAVRRRVRFTHKALRELASLDMGLDVEDACDVLAALRPEDSGGRVLSVLTGEWMYVFKPKISETVMYLKLVLRVDCVIVSFHEEGKGHDEQEGA